MPLIQPTDPNAWPAARKWMITLVTLAIIWRIVRYALAFPVWGDEASLLLNLVGRHSYSDLLRPLDNYQVAPVGFLFTQFAIIRHLGTSEYALRLFPLLTGILGIICFARLTWLALPPIGATAALGVLVATHYVTRYSLDIKPYGTDLLAASLLLLLALQWLQRPGQLRWLILLTMVAPVTMAFSYPAVFVTTAVGLALLPVACRRAVCDRRPADPYLRILVYGLFGLISAGAFIALMSLSTQGQYDHSRSDMIAYWQRGLPPANPLKFVVWIFDVHTAEMMSYPLGGKNAASTGTFILCLIGIRVLWKRQQKPLLALLGTIFTLTFLAAVLRRYPYGGSARIAQHLAPAICLFVGAAIDGLITSRNHAPPIRYRWANGVLVALLAIAMGGLIRDILHPFQTAEDKRAAVVFREYQQAINSSDGVYLLDPLARHNDLIQWHILKGTHWDQARLFTGLPTPEILAQHTTWWIIQCDPARDLDATLTTLIDPATRQWHCIGRWHQPLPTFQPNRLGQFVEIQRWQAVP